MFNLILAVLIALFLLAFLVLPGESDLSHRAPFWGRAFAHRGLHTQNQTVPENSMQAFRAAVEAGYGIELDVQLSRDGWSVVFHDDTLERACGLNKRVGELDLEELQKLRLFGTDQTIPALSEVLSCVDGQVPLIIELKMGPDNKKLCENTWRLLRRYDGDICIESFDPRIVRWFRKKVPGVLRGQLSAPPAELGNGIAGMAVGLLLTNCLCRPQFIAYKTGPKPLTVKLAERLSMRVAWTVRPSDGLTDIQQKSDAIIFEYMEPEIEYKTPPEEVMMGDHPVVNGNGDQELEPYVAPGPSFEERLEGEQQDDEQDDEQDEARDEIKDEIQDKETGQPQPDEQTDPEA